MRNMMTYLPGPHSGHDGVSCHASRDHGVSANCAFHGARGVRAFRALHAFHAFRFYLAFDAFRAFHVSNYFHKPSTMHDNNNR